MTIPPRHPSYAKFLQDWAVCRDVAAGESAVKMGGTRYLPATSGMRLDGFPHDNTAGYHAYMAYRDRAVFPSVYAEAVNVALGVLHREPAKIELPKVLEAMRERATPDGNTLEALLRVINGEQLTTGRLGLLVEPINGTPIGTTPRILTYSAESIVNWDTNLVVLDQSGPVRNERDQWQVEAEYLRLSVENGRFVSELQKPNNYTEHFKPSMGGRYLSEIPFVFVNGADLRPEPTEAPLIGLARLALTIYRLEADYRQALFLQGQDTLVVIGGNSMEGAQRVGAGASIHLPKGSDAKFIGASSAGLPEMRSALENDYKRAIRLGLGLLDTSTRERESGEALKTRVAAATASLTQIAIAGAAALERALRYAAVWMNANPDEVVVTPNLEFAKDEFDARDLTELLNAKSLGAPLSLKSIHEMLKAKDVTALEFEDELAQIEDEEDGLRRGRDLIEGPDDDEDDKAA